MTLAFKCDKCGTFDALGLSQFDDIMIRQGRKLTTVHYKKEKREISIQVTGHYCLKCIQPIIKMLRDLFTEEEKNEADVLQDKQSS